ncbi:IS1096 element passenger TnpR family protein [Succinatimonas hippei]|uniref:IS1096 element passenger TnpR family protein n=1 Tax=Succinatimonas hippei TaxID=626938 RepID=UPI0031E7A635
MLHIALQHFYNFDNYHLSEFNLGKKQNVTFDGETEEVDALLEAVLRVDEKFQYVYDFGDYWVKITKINEKRRRNANALIEAQGAGPMKILTESMDFMNL